MVSRLITVAPNGARKMPGDHPRLPVTPETIAEEARLAAQAGAALLHLHVRHEDGSHSLEPGHYRDAMAAVREACGNSLMIQITTESAGVYGWHQQVRAVTETSPEAASIALRELCLSDSPADRSAYTDFLTDCRAEGVWLQHILYDTTDVTRFGRFFADGHMGPNPFVLLVVGRYAGDTQSTPAELDAMCDLLPADCSWAACAFGLAETEILDHALARGGHVRVGFENNVLHADGSPADGNADRVRVVAGLMAERGIEPMSAEEIVGAFGIFRNQSYG